LGLAGDVPGGPYVISDTRQAPFDAWLADCGLRGWLRFIHNLRRRFLKGHVLIRWYSQDKFIFIPDKQTRLAFAHPSLEAITILSPV
jgi:hypothetical protein